MAEAVSFLVRNAPKNEVIEGNWFYVAVTLSGDS